MNKVILIGNLTRDPEISTTSSGIFMCRFSIAVNRRFGRENNEADYFNVIAWRTLGENCGKILTKGRKVCVVGSIQIRNYEGNDGVKRTAVEVTADEVEFLSSPRGEGENAAPAPRREEAPAPKLERMDTPEEDLPF